MAIAKDIPLDFGGLAKYHRILRVSVNFTAVPPAEVAAGSALLTVEVGCYMTQAARAAGKTPATSRTVGMWVASEATRDVIYTTLMAPMTYTTVNDMVPGVDGSGNPILVPTPRSVPTGLDTGFNGGTAV